MADEEAQGNHAIARHVGRSKERLPQRADRNRIGIGKRGLWEDRIGSFTSLTTANNLVPSTLARNSFIVKEVIAGKQRFAKIEAWFETPTGYESYRRRLQDPAIIRETFGVSVIMIHDSHRSKGFRVKTAYPINRDDDAPRMRTMQIPEEFREMCIRFYQGVTEDFDANGELINYAISDLNGAQRKVVRDDLDELMSGRYSEEQIEAIWRAAGAEIRISRGEKGDSARFLGEIHRALES